MSTPKILMAIVCEDVRVEKNNKNILIGVYPDDIVISNVPATIGLTLWIRMGDIDPEQLSFEFRGLLGEHKEFQGEFQIAPPPDTGRATVVLGQFPLNIEKEGDFTFDLRAKHGGRWRNAVTMPVKIQDLSAA